MWALVELARPKDWVKSVFVLMPVPFALAAGASFDFRAFALGLIGFALGTSAVYAFNDAIDAERDRQHPRKRERPVASGRVSLRTAFAEAALLLLAAVALCAASDRPGALVILAVYVALQAIYSLYAKRVALLDVFLLSAGFVLRVLLGCALLEAPASPWLLLCSSALALLISLGRRRADLVGEIGAEHRPSLGGYNLAFIDQAIGVATAMTLVAYALYCIEAQVLIQGREFATLPFVVFAVLDYLRRIQVDAQGDSPVDMVLHSPVILLCSLGWLLAALWSLEL